MQDEIAQAVVDALKLKLLPSQGEKRAVNPEAHDLYLLGWHFLRQNSVDGAVHAIEHLEKALALDPGYALAWAALSRARFWAADQGPTHNHLAEQRHQGLGWRAQRSGARSLAQPGKRRGARRPCAAGRHRGSAPAGDRGGPQGDRRGPPRRPRLGPARGLLPRHRRTGPRPDQRGASGPDLSRGGDRAGS